MWGLHGMFQAHPNTAIALHSTLQESPLRPQALNVEKEPCRDGMTEQWPIAHRSTNTPKCDMVRPQVVASYAQPPIARSKRISSPGS